MTKRFTQERNIKLNDFAEMSYIVDMWSLGSILVEILSGFPLWLSLKSRVTSVEGRSVVNYGLFGVAGRDNGKILKKQLEILSGGLSTLMKTLKQAFDFTGQCWLTDRAFLHLLEQMLSMNAQTRINPIEVLEHPFL